MHEWQVGGGVAKQLGLMQRFMVTLAAPSKTSPLQGGRRLLPPGPLPLWHLQHVLNFHYPTKNNQAELGDADASPPPWCATCQRFPGARTSLSFPCAFRLCVFSISAREQQFVHVFNQDNIYEHTHAHTHAREPFGGLLLITRLSAAHIFATICCLITKIIQRRGWGWRGGGVRLPWWPNGKGQA